MRPDTIQELVRGDVITPEAPDYDAARAVFNGMIDRRPSAVVRAVDAADVMAVVSFAADEGLPLAVRGGGHSVPGYGVCDDGLVLDLSAIRNVRVDPQERTVRVGGGAVLADQDHATHAYGLATPAGFFSTTGVAGLTLGGGISAYLGREHGMTCDNLLSADVVTARGERVTARADQHPDLFWALRGGGGNFGVVTALEFRLHPVSTLVAGPMLFAPEGTADVISFYDRYMQEAPRPLGGFLAIDRAPPLPFIPEDRHGEPVCIVVASWNGDPSHADRILNPIRSSGPLVAEHVEEIPYPALQTAFDDLLPSGTRQYWKSDWVDEISPEDAVVYADHGTKVPNALSTTHLYPVNGAVHDVAEDATAFAVRDARFSAVIVGGWEDPADDEEHVAWVRDYYEAIHARSGHAGGYTNFAAADDEARVRDNFGPAYTRLAEIKARWDPDNLFRRNQNVKPAE